MVSVRVWGCVSITIQKKEKKKQWMVSPNIGHFVIKATSQNVMVVSSFHLPLLSNHFVFEVCRFYFIYLFFYFLFLVLDRKY